MMVLTTSSAVKSINPGNIKKSLKNKKKNNGNIKKSLKKKKLISISVSNLQKKGFASTQWPHILTDLMITVIFILNQFI